MGRPFKFLTRHGGLLPASAALSLLLACVTPQPCPPEKTCAPCAPCAGSSSEGPAVNSDPAEQARATVQRFVALSEAGNFEAAYQMLAGSWRARYTPQRLSADFSLLEQAARERLVRARLAAERPPRIADTTAEFPISESRSVRLVLENGAWHVAALE